MRANYLLKHFTGLSGLGNPRRMTISCVFLFLSLFIGNVKILAVGELTGEIAGSGGHCAGTTSHVILTISEGQAPFAVTLTRSGSNPDKDTIISGITSSPEIINVRLSGTYTLKNLTDANLNLGIISGNPVVLTEMPVPDVEIHGLVPAYDKGYYDMVPISGTPQGGIFSGPGLFNSNGSWYFIPSYSPVGTNQIIYSYRESESSCYGYDTTNVRVLEANASIDFPENRLKYCANEKQFVIKGINLANDTGSFSISGGIGLADNHDNTAIIDPSLLASKEYIITYTYYDGTPLTVNQTIEILGLDINEVNITNVVSRSKREIEVYPNPVKETFFINLGKLASDTKIVIAEMNGKIILQESYKNMQLIEISLLAPPGLYLLMINSEMDKVIFPIVKN